MAQNGVELRNRTVRNVYDSEEQREFWIRLAAGGLSRAENTLLHSVVSHSARDFLVVGCGGGRESFALANRGFHVVGMDIAAGLLGGALKEAPEVAERTGFVLADAAELPFRHSSFDCIVMFGQFLGHVPGRRRRRQALLEAARVLRQGGRLLVSLHNGSFVGRSILGSLWLRLARAKIHLRSVPGNATAKRSDKYRDTNPNVDVPLRVRQAVRVAYRRSIIGLRIALRTAIFGFLRIMNKLPSAAESPRDMFCHPVRYEVSFHPKSGLIPYHLYTHREFLEDTRQCGLLIDEFRSLSELNLGLEMPALARTLESILFYSLGKRKGATGSQPTAPTGRGWHSSDRSHDLAGEPS